jgi:hypothetical protein
MIWADADDDDRSIKSSAQKNANDDARTRDMAWNSG